LRYCVQIWVGMPSAITFFTKTLFSTKRTRILSMRSLMSLQVPSGVSISTLLSMPPITIDTSYLRVLAILGKVSSAIEPPDSLHLFIVPADIPIFFSNGVLLNPRTCCSANIRSSGFQRPSRYLSIVYSASSDPGRAPAIMSRIFSSILAVCRSCDPIRALSSSPAIFLPLLLRLLTSGWPLSPMSGRAAGSLTLRRFLCLSYFSWSLSTVSGLLPAGLAGAPAASIFLRSASMVNTASV